MIEAKPPSDAGKADRVRNNDQHRTVTVHTRRRSPLRAVTVVAICALSLAAHAAVSPVAVQAQTQAQGPEKPYDDRLMRLSEILGAVHYLRELCGANEGQSWRDRMRELLDAEGSNALRRARLSRSFNQGYYGYSKTHKICTQTAQQAIQRFMNEGAQIAEGLVRTIP